MSNEKRQALSALAQVSKKRIVIAPLVLLALGLITYESFLFRATGKTLGNDVPYILLTVDGGNRTKYGFVYPLTYVFTIPSGSSQLKVLHRFNGDESWMILPEKSSGDLFNGIYAARFDYSNNMAYISIGFNGTGNTIQLKFLDSANETVFDVGYLGIAKYYDNRKCVVTVTLDDWDDSRSSYFLRAINLLQERKIWSTVGIVTCGAWAYGGGFNATTWAEIQNEIDEGFVEPAAHSRTHPHPPYSNITWEVKGSKDDMVGNLTSVPYSQGLNKNVYAWFEPFGEWDDGIRTEVGKASYLIDREFYYTSDVSWGDYNSSLGIYVASHYLDPGGRWDDTGAINSRFDEAYKNGHIYHGMFHPAGSGTQRLTEEQWQNITAHLNYISGRKDVWYAGFGHLYMYHYLQDFSSTLLDVRTVGFFTDTTDSDFAQGGRKDVEITNGSLQLEKRLGSGFNFFKNGIDKTPATAQKWVDVDVSGDGVPVGATGVILEIVQTGSWRGKGHARKDGSTDDFNAQLMDGHSSGVFVGLSSSRQFEAYITGTQIKVYLKGYTDETLEFLTNLKDVTPLITGSWQDINVSSTVPMGARGVVCFILSTAATSKGIGVRSNGSTFAGDIVLDSGCYTYLVAPLDSGGIFEGFVQDSSVKIYLAGWAKSNAPITFKQNPDDISITVAGQWIDKDITSETSGLASGGIVRLKGSWGWKNANVRANGSTDSWLPSLAYNFGTAKGISLDSDQTFEGYVSSTPMSFHLLAYCESLGQGVGFGNNGSWTSKWHDAGQTVNWTKILWTGTTPPGTSMLMSTRTCPDSFEEYPDEGKASPWSENLTVSSGSNITSPNGRYLQYRVYLLTNGSSTPILHSATVIYASTSQPAYATLTIDSTPVKGECFINSTSLGTTPQTRKILAGTYVVSWGNMAGYFPPPSQTVVLAENQEKIVNGVYEAIPPPAAKYSLSVYSEPMDGFRVEVSNSSHIFQLQTGSSVILTEGKYNVTILDVMIEVTFEQWKFASWSDGNISTSRTINLSKETILLYKYAKQT